MCDECDNLDKYSYVRNNFLPLGDIENVGLNMFQVMCQMINQVCLMWSAPYVLRHKIVLCGEETRRLVTRWILKDLQKAVWIHSAGVESQNKKLLSFVYLYTRCIIKLYIFNVTFHQHMLCVPFDFWHYVVTENCLVISECLHCTSVHANS
jgi:hypothetical protein